MTVQSPSLERLRRRPRFLPKNLQRVQKYLDRCWPGLVLRLNPREGCWIVTDLAYHANGQPNRYWVRPPRQSNRGAIGTVPTLESTIAQFVQRVLVIDGEGTGDFYAYQPCRDRLAEMLNFAFHGNDRRLIEVLEERRTQQEEAEQEAEQRQSRDAARASAETAWHRHKGRIMAGGGVVTDQRKINRSIDKQLRKEQEEASLAEQSEIEAYIREQSRKGHVMGI